jgi:hypothetical protein
MVGGGRMMILVVVSARIKMHDGVIQRRQFVEQGVP